MRTYVYVDGFNLYYGALRATPYRWLDLAKLCGLLLPQNQINQIRYYTAKVNARPSDQDQPVRQQTYLRALRTLPNVSIHLGHFLTHEVFMPLANPPAAGPSTVKVIKAEEKGSDVNLATHLLDDGYQNRYDVAVVLSNDSDLAEPIRLVKSRLAKKVGVINPHQKPSRKLQSLADFMKQIRPGPLSASQFPVTLSDEQGTFRKPKAW